jgi:hypothetical protein
MFDEGDVRGCASEKTGAGERDDFEDPISSSRS